jgi:hypothetical protein
MAPETKPSSRLISSRVPGLGRFEHSVGNNVRQVSPPALRHERGGNGARRSDDSRGHGVRQPHLQTPLRFQEMLRIHDVVEVPHQRPARDRCGQRAQGEGLLGVGVNHIVAAC